MEATRRTWSPRIVVGAGLAGLAGLCLLAWEFAGSATPRLELRGERGARAAAADPARAPRDRVAASDGERGEPDATSPDRDPAVGASRAVEPVDPLAAIDPRESRKLEQRGRALFCGVVLDPQRRPCPGARIFHAGEPVARSDEHGAWRFEAQHDVFADDLNLTGHDEPPILAALKEGVGVACVQLHGRSRRIDLVLQPGSLVKGRTVEREGGAIVPDATIDLLVRPAFVDVPRFAFGAQARSGSDGTFLLGQVPAGAIELRARADGHDSDCFFSQSVEPGELVDVDILMDPVQRVRGWFSPWPPSSMVDPSKAEVRAWAPTNERRWYDARTLVAKVDGGARFELALPGYARCTIALACDRDAWWFRTLELDRQVGDAGDVDLGKIALEPTGEARGRFDVPPEVLAIGFDVHGTVATPDGEIEFGRPLEADGSFRIGPLPPGELEVAIAHGKSDVRIAGPAFTDPRIEGGLELVGGATLDLGAITPAETFFCGRVVDEAGVPIAWAGVSISVVDDADDSVRSESARTDPDGRWCNTAQLLDPDADSTDPFVGRVELRVEAPGWAPARIALAMPGARAAVRHDVVMAGGRTLAGVVTGFDDERLVGAHVQLASRDPAADLVAFDVTGSDGRFEIRGLPDGEFTLTVTVRDVAQLPGNAGFVFAPRRSGGEECALSLRDAIPELSSRRASGSAGPEGR